MLRDLKRALLAAAMVLALSGFALAHDERAGGSDVSRRGYQQGYNDGFQHGREDHDRNSDYNYQGDDYRRADRGYDSQYGDRDQFVAGYRDGYRAGYDDGYNGRSGRSESDYGRDDHDRNGSYDREGRHRRGGYGYNDAAYDTGYRDGIEGAQKDIRKRKGFDFNDHDWYRDAKRGYSSSYGDKESYRQRYRQGYEAGYRDTFDTAYATGYRDGMVGARKDLHRHQSPDPTRHNWYRDAKRGYDGRNGNHEDYRQRYRQGYVAGYNDAYSGQGY